MNRMHAIELNEERDEKTARRFSGSDSVGIVDGDSGVEPRGLMDRIGQPPLRRLDMHWNEV